MKRFIKMYWPMIISIMFFGIYGIFVGTLISSQALFDNDGAGICIVIITALLVIGVWSGIIYFIIHAIKNKKSDERMWWCIGVYFLNVFIMPYYNLKCVCDEKKIKPKMLAFAGLSILFFIVGIIIPVMVDSTRYEDPLYIVEDNVKFTFPSSYKEMSVGEYDIYAKDTRRNINFGGFIYTEDDDESADSVMNSRDYWIKTSREKVTVLDKYEEELDDRKITTNVYIASNDGVRNMYFISVVEFKSSDVFVNTLGINLHDDYLQYKEEFRQILVNMEYIGTGRA